MTKSWFAQLLLRPVALVVYALWAVLFYQLVLTGWTIDYSYVGALGVLAVTALLVLVFRKEDRRFVVRFTLFCLTVSFGIASYAGESGIWRIIDWIVLAVLATVLGRILIKIKVGYLLVVIVALTIAQAWVPLEDMSVLSAFSVRYIGHMSSPDPQVPSIPVTAVANPIHPQLDTIVSLAGHSPQKGEAQSLIDLSADPAYTASALDAIKELQHSYDLVQVVPGRFTYHQVPVNASELSRVSDATFGLIDFPFTTAHFLDVDQATRMYVSLSKSPSDLLSILLSPGTLANSMAHLSLQTQASVSANWDQVTGISRQFTQGLTIDNGFLSGMYNGTPVHVRTTGVAILGIAHLLPTTDYAAPQAVLEGDNVLQVVTLPPDTPRVIAVLRGSYQNPLTTDIVFGDVTGAGYDQLLVNTVPAEILQLQRTGSWQTLWVSGRPTFRFESVFPQAGGDLVIANAPSFFSPNPTRYLSGFHYANHALSTVWRVYHGDIVDVHTVHVSSPTTPELLTSVYAHEEIMLLSPTRIPWLLLTEVMYGVIVLMGLWRSIRGGRAA